MTRFTYILSDPRGWEHNNLLSILLGYCDIRISTYCYIFADICLDTIPTYFDVSIFFFLNNILSYVKSMVQKIRCISFIFFCRKLILRGDSQERSIASDSANTQWKFTVDSLVTTLAPPVNVLMNESRPNDRYAIMEPIRRSVPLHPIQRPHATPIYFRFHQRFWIVRNETHPRIASMSAFMSLTRPSFIEILTGDDSGVVL